MGITFYLKKKNQIISRPETLSLSNPTFPLLPLLQHTTPFSLYTQYSPRSIDQFQPKTTTTISNSNFSPSKTTTVHKKIRHKMPWTSLVKDLIALTSELPLPSRRPPHSQ